MPNASQPPFLLLHRPHWRQSLIALFALLATTFITKLSLFAHFSEAFLGGSERDAGLYLWLIRSNIKNFYTLPFFETQAFYPYGQALGWSDNFLLPSWFVGILLKSGLTFTQSYNTLLLTALLLFGYLTFRVSYLLSGRFHSSLGSGMIVLALAPMTALLGHPQLQFAFFFPLAVWYLLIAISKKTIFPALSFGIVLFLSFLTTIYYTIFLVLLGGLIILGVVFLRPKHLSPRDLATIAFGAALGAFPVIPFVAPYLQVQQVFGERGVYEAYYFAATLRSYLVSTDLSLVYHAIPGKGWEEVGLFPGILLLCAIPLALRRISDTHHLSTPRRAFFSSLGLSCLFSVRSLPWISPSNQQLLCAFFVWTTLLSLAWVLLRLGALERRLKISYFTNRDIIALLLLALITFLALSFGPLGNPEKGQLACGLYTPLYYLVPGMSGIRAVSRAGLVVLFIIPILGTLVLPARWEKKLWIPWLITALVIAENWSTQFPLQSEPSAPGVLDAISHSDQSGPPSPTAVIFLPLTSRTGNSGEVLNWGDFAELNVQAMNWMASRSSLLVNGYSGQRTKFMTDAPRELREFPDQRSLRTLHSIAGLTHVVYRSTRDSNFTPQEFADKLKTLSKSLSLADYDTDGNYLFSLGVLNPMPSIFEFLTPPTNNARLEITLRAAATKKCLPVPIQAFLPNHVPGVAVSAIDLPCDDTPHSLTIRLPNMLGGIKPIKVLLSHTSAPENITLVKTRLFSESPHLASSLTLEEK